MGYCTLGHVVKNWKHRWFVIKKDTMYYFKSKKVRILSNTPFSVPWPMVRSGPNACFTLAQSFGMVDLLRVPHLEGHQVRWATISYFWVGQFEKRVCGL